MEKTKNTIKDFTDLDAWKEGHALVLMIYTLTKKFPREEQYGLSAQMRRASVSFTSNIAEGFKRNSYKEKIRFYSVALASLSELQNQLFVARDVGFIAQEKFDPVYQQTMKVGKITQGLIRSSRLYI